MRSIWWPSALAITACYMIADALPGPVANMYTEVLGPLFAGVWLAALFRRWWRSHQSSVLAWPTGRLTAVLAVAALLLLLGGLRLFWVDPWLFGPMAWPLVEIALTSRRRGLPAGTGECWVKQRAGS